MLTIVASNENWASSLELVAENILEARDIALARQGLGTWVRHLLSGIEGEAAWASLHRASENLIAFQPPDVIATDIPELRARLLRYFDREDPRFEDYLGALTRIEGDLASSSRTEGSAHLTLPEEANADESTYSPLRAEDRLKLQAITRAINQEHLAALGALRAYRNLIVIVILLLLVVLVALPVIAGHLDTSFLAFTTPAVDTSPNGQSQGPVTWAAFAALEFWGGVGGLVGTLFALHRLQAYRGPLGVHIAQALLKLPAGSLIALFGVVVVQGELINHVSPPARPELAAYACLFGFSQEAITRLVDKKASDLVTDVVGSSGKHRE